MKDYVGYKIKIYPNESQKNLLNRYIGACRFVYNHFLIYSENEYRRKKEENPEATGKLRPSKLTMTTELTRMKHTEEYKWLNEIPVSAMNYAIFHLDNAYELYFNTELENNKPKLKTKKDSKKSCAFRNDRLRITKTGIKVDKIKDEIFCSNHNIPLKTGWKDSTMDNGCQEVYSPTITFDGDNYWFSCQLKTIRYEVDEDVISKDNDIPEETDNMKTGIGIDLGVKTTAYCSDNTTWNIDECVNERKRLSKAISRYHRRYVNRYYANYDGTKPKFSESKERESKRCQKARGRIRKKYRKITNKCKNSIHHFVNSVIEKKPKFIVMEDLSVIEIRKGSFPPISKKIAKLYWYTIREIMSYKARWNDIPFALADREYPSTQRCSRCKNILTGDNKLKIGQRVYKCPVCGLEIDRDYNASLNLLDWYDIKDTWKPPVYDI